MLEIGSDQKGILATSPVCSYVTACLQVQRKIVKSQIYGEKLSMQWYAT